MEAGMNSVIKIVTDGQLIRTFTSYELERELYERNLSYEEFYRAIVEDFKHKQVYENVNFESDMYINMKKLSQPSKLFKSQR